MAFIRLQLRRDTAANWTSANPTLAEGEIGIETDTEQFKIGNGADAWDDLIYAGIQGDVGPPGADGRTILSGAVDPTTEGANGDFYINTATSTLFGPKASGTWPSGVPLIGADGADAAIGGSDTHVQFNDGGVFGGEAAFAWNKTTNALIIAGQATGTIQTLTDGANVDWDCSAGAKAKVTLGGNRTVNAVTNAVEGTSYTLWVIQDNSGSRTITWTTSGAGSFDFGTDGAPTLTTTGDEADLLGFEAISIGGTLKLRFVGIKKGFA
jgi:hypothetical protein